MTRIVLLAVLALSGCYIDFGDGSDGSGPAEWRDDGRWVEAPPPPDPGYAYDPITYEVTGDTLAGSMGNVEGFEGGIFRTAGSGWEGYSSVQIDAANATEAWWVMGRMDIQGGLEHEALVPGAHFEFDSSSGAYGDGTEVFISMLGCSGPAEGMWEYDQYAEEVEIDVEEGSEPSSLTIRFRATFQHTDWETGASTPQIVDGSFSYTRP